MILFTSDYTEGAHPRIIEKLAETNMEQTVGYGEDHTVKLQEKPSKKYAMHQKQMFIFWWEEPRRILQ